MDYKFKYSKAPIKTVEAIQFGVLSPEYIENTSVTQEQYDISGAQIPAGIFDHNNIYDQSTKKPVIGGINDPRMGNIMDSEHPGYFGHIKLAVPIYHYCFMQTILNLLKSVSYWTSKLIVSEKDLQYITKSFKKRKRLSEITKITQKSKTCKDTKKALPSYSRDGLKILIDFPDQGLKRTLTTKEAYSILEKISDEDAIKVGLNPKFCRPEHLMITVMPVPPPHVRPTVSMSSTQKCEDDLTHKINDILRANIAVQNAIKNKEKPHVIEYFENLLQYHVSTFFDNKIPGQKPSQQRSGKPLKTLRQRLVGKDGRVRGNLMGKRVDFSARSVITADPNIDMDQLGVPQDIALNMTVPEKVTEYNKAKLQALVKNGPNKHPGAKYVILEGNRKIDLNYYKKDISLKVGDVVERHLDNDDIVLFNRQPSLHKMSIMAHRVKTQNHKTFRLNLAVVSPYNADFDGDEMNMHVPQSQTAMAEAENLMAVPYMIVSPQSNKPVMGIIQDSLLSTYLFTSRDIFIERDLFMNGIGPYMSGMSSMSSMGDKIVDIINKPALLISQRVLKALTALGMDYGFRAPMTRGNRPTTTTANGPSTSSSPNESHNKPSFKQLWTGKQYFSSILDPRVNIRRVCNGAPENDNEMSYTDTRVLISKGYLLRGRIDKKSIGTSEGSLIHTMFNDLGPHETMQFMNKIQKIANYWILHNGFTVGIKDTIIGDYTKVYDILESVKEKVNVIIDTKANKNNSKNTDHILEQEINSELNGARDEAGNYVQKVLSFNNNFKSTVYAGSKGNNLNIAQVIACLGQQNIEGHRVSYGFRNRTLPHYDKMDIGYESRGFVENSYISALKPQEFFFHAMAGREGIIDTACKTAQSGYTQRRVVKSLEDVSVRYDGTVRDSYGNIVQFLYGEDGIDAIYIESHEFKILTMSNKEMADTYRHEGPTGTTGPESPTGLEDLMNQEYQQLLKDRETLRTAAKHREPSRARVTDKIFHIPINISRIMNLRKYVDPEGLSPLMTPREIITEVQNLVQELNGTELFGIHLRSNLASKVLTKAGITRDQFYVILEDIKLKYKNAIVHAGEMCGIVAAQSVSELTTQLTLNSFHSSGISAKNITLGLPRLNELINISKKIKSPGLKLFIPIDSKNLGSAGLDGSVGPVGAHLEYKILRDFVSVSSIKNEPLKNELEEVVSLYNTFGIKLSSYYLRLDIDVKLLEYTGVTMYDIYKKIVTDKKIRDKGVLASLRIFVNDDNADEPCIVIFATDDEDIVENLKNIEIEYINKIQMMGIPGITKVYEETKTLNIENPDTGAFESVNYKCIETEGSNLEAIFSVPGFDHTMTLSNNIIEIWQVLGVEAARKALLNELKLVLSFDGSYINYRHLSLVADIMTYKGVLLSLTRHSQSKADTGTLVKASFEETVEILTEAAMYSQKDQIKGVSENIMLGQLAPCGTGTFDVLLDESMLTSKEYIPSSPKRKTAKA
jgi:DNA-directed RNA polymerase II subunit RPB1